MQDKCLNDMHFN